MHLLRPRACALAGGLALLVGAGTAGAAGASPTPNSGTFAPVLSSLLGSLQITGHHPAANGVFPKMNVSNATGAGTQQAELYSVDGQADGFAGVSTAVSGTTAVVGAFEETANGNSEQGVAYVFAKSGSTWALQAVLTGSDGQAGDEFGSSVAISGSTIVVGSPHHDVNGQDSQGAAYVFTKSGAAWTQTAELTASDGTEESEFGSSVTTTGSTVIVGDPSRQTANGTDSAVYDYVKSGSAWLQKVEIISPGGSDGFGYAVGLSGTTLAVGIPFHNGADDANQGEVDIYTLSGATAKLDQSFTDPVGGAEEELGESVSVSGTTVLAGAPGDDDSGRAYVLAKSGTTWIQQADLMGTDTGEGDDFGLSVSISSSTILVGAPLHMVGTNVQQGAAYVFTKSGTAWKQASELTASDGATSDLLGYSVSDSGTTALVGAPEHNIGNDQSQGAAYVFAS